VKFIQILQVQIFKKKTQWLSLIRSLVYAFPREDWYLIIVREFGNVPEGNKAEKQKAKYGARLRQERESQDQP